jgi:hypothetical protein
MHFLHKKVKKALVNVAKSMENIALIIVFVSHGHYDLRSSFVKSHTTLKPADFIKEQEEDYFRKCYIGTYKLMD